jgi:hypothetical protein
MTGNPKGCPDKIAAPDASDILVSPPPGLFFSPIKFRHAYYAG